MPETRIIAALAYPGAQLLDIAGPLETFNLASRQLMEDGERRDAAYRVEIVARESAVPTMSGLALQATRRLDEPLDGIDTVILPGAQTGNESFFTDPDYLAWTRRLPGRVRRVCSVCSGALLLAAAGLLDNRRATTHWMDAPYLRQQFPRVRVEENRIYIEDGGIYTSGGITAGIDLALALVERDHSRRLALKVAKRLLVFLKRPGDQLQFNSFLQAQAQPTRFAALLDWLTENLHRDLSTAELAQRACMSERNFRRRFEAELGQSAHEYLTRARVIKAQSLLESTALPLSGIAARCGFRSPAAMRYAFQRRLDVTPSDYRQRFGAGARDT